MQFKTKFDIGDAVYYPSSDRMAAVVIKDYITAVIVVEDGVKYMTNSTQYGLPEKKICKTYKRAAKALELELLEKKEEVVGEIDSVVEKIRSSSKKELLFDATASSEKAK